MIWRSLVSLWGKPIGLDGAGEIAFEKALAQSACDVEHELVSGRGHKKANLRHSLPASLPWELSVRLFRPVLYGYLCHAETVRLFVWGLMKNLVRWIGVAPGLVCLALVVDLAGSAAVKQWKRERTERETLEAEARQEPYRNQEWGHRYWEEMNQYRERWESYWIYRLSDRHGEFLNVTNGVRGTYLPRGSWPGHSHTVFLFGGSAAWGHGARDQATLASWLARVGEEHGERLDVRNYAESGWVNWQGILYLLEKLTDGERPDVVIFYSGVNEAMSARLWPQVRRPLYDGEMTKAALT